MFSCSAWGIVYLLYISYFAHKGTSYKAKLSADWWNLKRERKLCPRSLEHEKTLGFLLPHHKCLVTLSRRDNRQGEYMSHRTHLQPLFKGWSLHFHWRTSCCHQDLDKLLCCLQNCLWIFIPCQPEDLFSMAIRYKPCSSLLSWETSIEGSLLTSKSQEVSSLENKLKNKLEEIKNSHTTPWVVFYLNSSSGILNWKQLVSRLQRLVWGTCFYEKANKSELSRECRLSQDPQMGPLWKTSLSWNDILRIKWGFT